MKKFSENINKQNDTKESDPIINMIEETLNIKVEGNIDDYLAKNISIDGISNLASKIKDRILLTEQEVLESIKYNGYQKTESMILEKQTAGEIKKHKQRVLSLLDKEDVEKQTNLQADRIKNGEKSFYRAMAAEQMVAEIPERKKDLKKIHDIFLFRSKQLGFKK
jgi:hypothetical protein